MKKSLILILFIVISFITNVNASSINYNLKIDESMHFYETISYTIPKNEIKNDGNYHFLTSVYNNPIYFNEDTKVKYKKSKSINGDNYIVTLKHDYPSIFLNGSRILKECFSDVSIDDTNNEFSFKSSSPFYCNHRADSITVNITTDLRVTQNNADSVNNNTYTWNNLDNSFSLRFGVRANLIEENQLDDTDEEPIREETNNAQRTEKKSTPSYITISIIIGFIFLGLSALIILKKKKDALDEI